MGSCNFTVCVTLMLLVMVGAISIEPKIDSRRLGRPHRFWDPLIRSPVDRDDDDETEEGGGGVRWAVLVAGSNGYGNYRHQVINDHEHADSTLEKN